MHKRIYIDFSIDSQAKAMRRNSYTESILLLGLLHATFARNDAAQLFNADAETPSIYIAMQTIVIMPRKIDINAVQCWGII